MFEDVMISVQDNGRVVEQWEECISVIELYIGVFPGII